MTRRRLAAIAAVFASFAPAPGAQASGRQQTAGSCDSACLTRLADAYFAALAAHDPSRVPIAPAARFTENTQPMAIGEGLWKTASEAPTTFKIYVPDPVAGQLGAIVVLKESGKPVELALRLKVENGRITEAEHLIARNLSEAGLANLQQARPSFSEPVPPGERLPRELMLVIAHSYYDAIEQDDGDVAPFADECLRRENGLTTAGPPTARPSPLPGAPAGGRGGAPPRLQRCRDQLETRAMSYIDSIDLRRVWIADVEKGLVFGLSMFRHPMQDKTLTILNADGTRSTRDMNFNPFDLPAAHIFKIRGGRIYDIEAMGFTMPLYSKNGWSEFVK